VMILLSPDMLREVSIEVLMGWSNNILLAWFMWHMTRGWVGTWQDPAKPQ
jgi:hypothetical protein